VVYSESKRVHAAKGHAAGRPERGLAYLLGGFMNRFKVYKSKNKASTSRDTVLTTYGSSEHARWLFERGMKKHDPEVQKVIRRVKSSENFLKACDELGIIPQW